MNWLYKRGCNRFEDMSDLAKEFRLQLAARRARTVCPRSCACSVPAMAPANGCCAPMTPRPSRWSTSRRPIAAPCASPRRWAARSTVRSAPPRSRASTAISARAEIVGQVWLANPRARLQTRRRSHHHQRRAHGHGRAAGEFPQRHPGAAHLTRRPGVRSVAPARDAVDLGTGAADLPPGAGEQRRAGGVAARARRLRCAASWCRSTACIRSPNCSRPAGTTSTSRTAAASPSSTSCSTASTMRRRRRARWRGCSPGIRPRSI